MILVMRGLNVKMWSLISVVGKGSRAQVEGFILVMIPSTSLCVVVEKQQRGQEITGRRGGETGGVTELESWERMVSTLVLKKVRKLLHFSSVNSVFVGRCGWMN